MDIKGCQIYWSVGQHRLGCATELGKSSWKIMKGAMVVARGIKSGTLYTTAGCMNMVAIAESASNSSLWHNRLGNMRVKGMKMLGAKGVLEGLKSVDMGPCENCVMSRQKRVSFTKTASELKKVRLEMVHTDFGDHLQFHHLEDQSSTSPSSMI